MVHPISIQPFLWGLMCQQCQIIRWGRTTPLETRGHVAMMGNLAMELDLTSLSDEEKAEIANQVNFRQRIATSSPVGESV